MLNTELLLQCSLPNCKICKKNVVNKHGLDISLLKTDIYITEVGVRLLNLCMLEDSLRRLCKFSYMAIAYLVAVLGSCFSDDEVLLKKTFLRLAGMQLL